MCECRKKLNKKLSDHLQVEGLIVDFEMISCKTFSTFEYQAGKRTKKQLILHSYCPFCGQKYAE